MGTVLIDTFSLSVYSAGIAGMGEIIIDRQGSSANMVIYT